MMADETLDVPFNFVDVARAHVTSNKTIKSHKKKLEVTRSQLLSFMQDQGHKEFEEESYKCVASHVLKHDVDEALLKAKHEDIFDRCAVTTMSFTEDALEKLKEYISMDTLAKIATLAITLDRDKLKNLIDLGEIIPDQIDDSIVETKNYWQIRVSNGG